MAILPYGSGSFAAGQVADGAKVYANDAAIETLVDGGLTEANLSGGAQIPINNLAQPYHTAEIVLSLEPRQVVLNWGTTNGEVHAVYPLPYDVIEGAVTYTVLAVDYVQKNSSATTPAFKIEWGHFTGGAWSTGVGAGGTGLLLASTVLALGTGNRTQGTAAISVNQFTTNVSQPRVLALVQNSATGGFGGAVGDFLTITVKLKIQHRA